MTGAVKQDSPAQPANIRSCFLADVCASKGQKFPLLAQEVQGICKKSTSGYSDNSIAYYPFD